MPRGVKTEVPESMETTEVESCILNKRSVLRKQSRDIKEIQIEI